jgi:type II secretory pathway component PulF
MLLGLPAITMLSTGHAARGHVLEGFILNLSQWLPENTAAVLVLGVIAFAATFRLLEKLDAQAEWPELFNQAPAREWRFPRLN